MRVSYTNLDVKAQECNFLDLLFPVVIRTSQISVKMNFLRGSFFLNEWSFIKSVFEQLLKELENGVLNRDATMEIKGLKYFNICCNRSF